MTVDATKPLGTDLVSTLDDYIRENRVSINEIYSSIATGISYPNYTAINMASGDTALVAGTDVDTSGVEVIGLTADAAVNLTTITNAVAGATKVIIALDSNVTVVQNTSSTTGGTFYINAPTGVDINLSTRDVMMFVNIGGDGVSADGYWVELSRKLQV